METKQDDNIKHSPPPAIAGSGKKGGRPKLPLEKVKKKRGFRVSDDVYNRVKELAALGKKSPGAIIEESIKESKIKPAPSVQNTVAWGDLSRVVANLNQIAFRVNVISKGGDGKVTTTEVAKLLGTVSLQVAALRREIRGLEK